MEKGGVAARQVKAPAIPVICFARARSCHGNGREQQHEAAPEEEIEEPARPESSVAREERGIGGKG